MIDSASLDEVPLVRSIRAWIRKWWGMEMLFADAAGEVANHADGVVIPPHNEICRAALNHPEGFRRCVRSVGAPVLSLGQGCEPGARLAEPCHLGFAVAMAPVLDHGRFQGALFCGGFLVRGTEEEVRAEVVRQSRALGLGVPDLAGVARRLPVLTHRELDYLGDLLETAADELAFQAEERSDPRVFAGLVGSSPAMQGMFTLIERVAHSGATTLILGENGTGKELIARAIHQLSPRRERPFVATNCSALTDSLLESELFGHKRGSFTGATADRKGLFEEADGGTIFLDEVGDISPALQVKLLRVLQEGEIKPAGSNEIRHVDVRTVSATNVDLEEAVARGRFREDLYYRLNVISLQVPPLRERKADLPALCDHFLRKVRAKGKGPAKTLSNEVIRRFWAYDWPGNVRQLENEIERLVVLSGEDAHIGPMHLSPAIRRNTSADEEAGGEEGSLREAVQALERRLIREGLIRHAWNKSRVAADLNVSRTTLIKKIRDLGLEDGPSLTG